MNSLARHRNIANARKKEVVRADFWRHYRIGEINFAKVTNTRVPSKKRCGGRK